ncbi:MAG TPA: ABC transporter ATP-binding protein [Dongiaceae bacterium]|nr:ABC transporter ATP-binding protein [Dongiaceae bacterium]
MSGGEVQLVDLTKRFGVMTAVDRINLHMPAGEFFSLLGSSGCGKTTTLRMIAGFEKPNEGRILLDGVDMTETPPHRRHVNTVFQSYALFPHLNVFDNVAFGLRRARVESKEVKRRVGEALALVQLTGFEKRKPAQMSGGQQQRVALARALVLKPAVLLLDEPLGALDAKLRKQLQIELKTLQQQVGITFIYVTHDQEEALTMSDRIAVMSHGRVEQVAPPQEVYEEPATVFVADFLGISNLMEATATGVDAHGRCRIKLGEFEFAAGRGHKEMRGATKATVRPERVRLEPHGAAAGENRLPGMVERWVYLGNAVQLIVRLATGTAIQALIQNTGEEIPYAQGTPVQVHLPPEALLVLKDTGERYEPEKDAAAAAG